MNYIRKICPNCGNEFVILESVEEKAIYCTLKCLLEFQYKPTENKVSSLLIA
ncbi:MAG TPA: hypothetical protein VGK06_12595 [Methanosarcina sp.]